PASRCPAVPRDTHCHPDRRLPRRVRRRARTSRAETTPPRCRRPQLLPRYVLRRRRSSCPRANPVASWLGASTTLHRYTHLLPPYVSLVAGTPCNALSPWLQALRETSTATV